MLDDPLVYCGATTTSEGCTPSISAHGIPSVTSGKPFEIRATNVAPNKPSMLFYGLSGREQKPFLGGTLCVNPPKYRTWLVKSSLLPLTIGPCNGVLQYDMNAFASGLAGGNPKPGLSLVGQQVNAQFWGRDAGAPPHFVYLSNALEYFVGP
jgi:hypothetical protein